MHGDGILSLFVQQIGNGRFNWLVMCRQWPIDCSRRSIQPALAVGFHAEGTITRARVHAGGMLLWLVIGRLFRIEIRIVNSCPSFLLFVPQHIFLSLGAGLTLPIGS